VLMKSAMLLSIRLDVGSTKPMDGISIAHVEIDDHANQRNKLNDIYMISSTLNMNELYTK
jgi:hypothetical protein